MPDRSTAQGCGDAPELRETWTGHGALRYRDIGSGPPLVLLHGADPGVTGWRDFRPVLPMLAQSFRCLVLEFPGFGVSDDVEGNPLLTAQGSFRRFVDALGLDQVDILGNSMGGGVATEFAVERPERVRRVVAVGGGGPGLFSPAPTEGVRALQAFADDPDRARLTAGLRSMVADPSNIAEAEIDERWEGAERERTIAAARRTFGAAAQAEVASASRAAPPAWSKLPALAAPALWAWGRDDRISPLDSALFPLRMAPDAELHVFPNCGHAVIREQPRAFARVASEFFQRP